MKKITYAIVFAAALLFNGCNSMHFFVVDDNNGKKDQTTVGAFNDETYIWESWSYSTNRVNEVK